MKVFRLASMAVLAAATLVTPAKAEHCSKVIVFSEVAGGRGVNPGVAGCDAEVNTNLIVPGSRRAIVAWTGASKPAGTVTVNDVASSLAGAEWDSVYQRWEFDPVELPQGPTTVRATAYPESDPTRTQSVTYRKPF